MEGLDGVAPRSEICVFFGVRGVLIYRTMKIGNLAWGVIGVVVVWGSLGIAGAEETLVEGVWKWTADGTVAWCGDDDGRTAS